MDVHHYFAKTCALNFTARLEFHCPRTVGVSAECLISKPLDKIAIATPLMDPTEVIKSGTYQSQTKMFKLPNLS